MWFWALMVLHGASSSASFVAGNAKHRWSSAYEQVDFSDISRCLQLCIRDSQPGSGGRLDQNLDAARDSKVQRFLKDLKVGEDKAYYVAAPDVPIRLEFWGNLSTRYRYSHQYTAVLGEGLFDATSDPGKVASAHRMYYRLAECGEGFSPWLLAVASIQMGFVSEPRLRGFALFVEHLDTAGPDGGSLKSDHLLTNGGCGDEFVQLSTMGAPFKAENWAGARVGPPAAGWASTSPLPGHGVTKYFCGRAIGQESSSYSIVPPWRYYSSKSGTTALTLTYFRKLAAASESEDDDDRLVFRIFLTPTYKSCQSDSSLYTPCKGRSLLAEALLARPGAMVSADLDSGGYCVPKVLLCDGVVNCMQSEAVGYDESACDRPEVVDEDSNLEVGVPLKLILSLSIIIPIVTLILAVSFYRCCNWTCLTIHDFKDVGKDLDDDIDEVDVLRFGPNGAAASGRIGATGLETSGGQNVEWNEMGLRAKSKDGPSSMYESVVLGPAASNHAVQGHPGRPISQGAGSSLKRSYERNGSKDSMENLLTEQSKEGQNRGSRRNISGSDSSGFESGRNYNSDETDSIEKTPPAVSAAPASSLSVPGGSLGRRQPSQQDPGPEEAGALLAAAETGCGSSLLGENIRRGPLSGRLPAEEASLNPVGLLAIGDDEVQDPLPEGYSRVKWDPLQPLAFNGYVPFSQVNDRVPAAGQQQTGRRDGDPGDPGANSDGAKVSLIPPPCNKGGTTTLSAPPSSSYITIDQANRLSNLKAPEGSWQPEKPSQTATNRIPGPPGPVVAASNPYSKVFLASFPTDDPEVSVGSKDHPPAARGGGGFKAPGHLEVLTTPAKKHCAVVRVSDPEGKSSTMV